VLQLTPAQAAALRQSRELHAQMPCPPSRPPSQVDLVADMTRFEAAVECATVVMETAAAAADAAGEKAGRRRGSSAAAQSPKSTSTAQPRRGSGSRPPPAVPLDPVVGSEVVDGSGGGAGLTYDPSTMWWALPKPAMVGHRHAFMSWMCTQPAVIHAGPAEVVERGKNGSATLTGLGGYRFVTSARASECGCAAAGGSAAKSVADSRDGFNMDAAFQAAPTAAVVGGDLRSVPGVHGAGLVASGRRVSKRFRRSSGAGAMADDLAVGVDVGSLDKEAPWRMPAWAALLARRASTGDTRRRRAVPVDDGGGGGSGGGGGVGAGMWW